MKRLLLIDANSIIHRSFHALPPFTAPDGRPSGAIYGIASILLKLWREEKPDYVAALFDRPEPTFRDKKYKEYKAQRPAAADELIAQIIEAHNLFAAFNIKTFEKPGYEADDLIATFAEVFKEKKEIDEGLQGDGLQVADLAHQLERAIGNEADTQSVVDHPAHGVQPGHVDAQLDVAPRSGGCMAHGQIQTAGRMQADVIEVQCGREIDRRQR